LDVLQYNNPKLHRPYPMANDTNSCDCSCNCADPLPLFQVGNEQLDSLDLKVALLTQGIYVHDAVYQKFDKTCRLSQNLYSCNTMFIADRLPIYIARTETAASPFHLAVRNDKPVVLYNDEFVTEVEFAPKPDFYSHKTSAGNLYGQLAIIQGWDILSFPYLWPCGIAVGGHPCRFCHCGNATLQAVGAKQWNGFEYRPEEIAEIVQYAVEADPKVQLLQLTAGSTFDADAEIDRYVTILQAIDKAVGLDRCPPFIFLTPPKDIRLLDKLFDAGVGKIACDLDVWSETLFDAYCPGKTKQTSRQRHLDALLYVADKYGPNRACSVFVAGLEPIDSLLAGFTYLAEHGIVPLPSPWMPYGVSAHGLPDPPGLDYYRTMRRETAKLYIEHNLVISCTVGSSVCLSSDIWLRRTLLAG